MNYIESQTLTTTEFAEGHSSYVRCVAVINDNTIVSGSDDNSLKIWDIKSGEEIKSLTGHSDFVTCVSVIDENTIVSGSRDYSLKIWDVNSGEEIKILTGHSDWVTCVAVINENTIVSGSDDKSIKIWFDKGKYFRQEQRYAICAGFYFCRLPNDLTRWVAAYAVPKSKIWD